ncbi:hypothetical protein F5Y16DRAFT_416572 [Xylariaceae sp. FL0255]|nr:hypothetical protein F5Y16DRAFT_416572 [Xylariaceae sp. FL0255]
MFADAEDYFDGPSHRFIGKRSPPVTAQICTESRAIACKQGRLVCIKNLNLSIEDCRGTEMHYLGGADFIWNGTQWSWFDPGRDTSKHWIDLLLLGHECGMNHICKLQDVLRCVQHIAVSYHSLGVLLWDILDPSIFPHLKTIDVIVGSKTYHLGSDASIEKDIWPGEHNIMFPIYEVDFDADKEKSAVTDMASLGECKVEDGGCLNAHSSFSNSFNQVKKAPYKGDTSTCQEVLERRATVWHNLRNNWGSLSNAISPIESSKLHQLLLDDKVEWISSHMKFRAFIAHITTCPNLEGIIRSNQNSVATIKRLEEMFKSGSISRAWLMRFGPQYYGQNIDYLNGMLGVHLA